MSSEFKACVRVIFCGPAFEPVKSLFQGHLSLI